MDGTAARQSRNSTPRWVRTIAGGRKSVPLALLAVAGLLSSQLPMSSGVREAAAAGNQFAMTGQTASAFAGSFDPSTGLETNIGVFQSGSGSTAQTMLFYEIGIVGPDWSFTDLENGFGPIPNADVQVTGGARPSALTLNTDTSASANPNFYRFAGSGGVVSVSWAATPFFSNTFTGSNQGRMGRQITFQSSGGGYNSSASATGSIVGRTLMTDPQNSFAYLSSFQGISVCRACP